MIGDMELWQVFAALGGLLVTLDRSAGVLERLGGMPGRVGRWLGRTYRERVEMEERDAKLTALITNGINERVDMAMAAARAAAAEVARVALMVESHRTADRAALDDHIQQTMQEHAALNAALLALRE